MQSWDYNYYENMKRRTEEAAPAAAKTEVKETPSFKPVKITDLTTQLIENRYKKL